MDILRVLSSTDLEVRSKCLDLVLDLISSRNIEEVTQKIRAVLSCSQKKSFSGCTSS